MKKIFLLFTLNFCVITFSFAQFLGQGSTVSSQGNFSQYLNKTIVKNSTLGKKGAAITSFNNEENTVGERFLFKVWVEGDSIINPQGVLINTTGYIFNFDKVTGSLLVTQDKINNMLVSANGIQSFVLRGMGRRYFFEHVKAIDSVHFFLAMVKNDNKYSLYKRFKTKYLESNSRNDGIIQTGNDYNEYKDEHEYYVVDEVKDTSMQIDFKPKDIKELFPLKKDEVSAYLKKHRDDEMNDNFLVGLVAYLNEQP